MNVVIYINGNDARFFCSAGWYSHEEFNLLKIELLNVSDERLYIFGLQFIKFGICVGIERLSKGN